jgi:hypothetical protein
MFVLFHSLHRDSLFTNSNEPLQYTLFLPAQTTTNPKHPHPSILKRLKFSRDSHNQRHHRCCASSTGLPDPALPSFSRDELHACKLCVGTPYPNPAYSTLPRPRSLAPSAHLLGRRSTSQRHARWADAPGCVLCGMRCIGSADAGVCVAASVSMWGV